MISQVKKNKYKTYFFLLYRALACDYFFYFAIDTLYLSQVKNMSFSSISLLITVFALFYIVFSIPAPKIVKRLGTANSSRLGVLLLLVSIVLVFFDPWVIFVSRAFYAAALCMKNVAETKILKDNLKMYGLGDNYSKYYGIAKVLNIVFDAGTCLVAGLLFDAWVYAPIVICAAILFVCFVMSFFIKNEKELYKKEHHIEHNSHKGKNELIPLFKYHTTWLLILFSFFFFGLIYCSIDINKMTFQEIGFSALTISIVSGVVRIVSALSIYGFNAIYKKLKFNAVYIIIACVAAGMLMVGLGGTYLSGIAALIIMSVGTAGIYVGYHTFDIVRIDFVMNGQGLTKRQTLLSLSNTGCYLGRLVVSLSLSGILTSMTASMSYLVIAASLIPFMLLFTVLLAHKKKVNKY